MDAKKDHPFTGGLFSSRENLNKGYLSVTAYFVFFDLLHLLKLRTLFLQ